ncbi:hypothetical protein [Candidatus Cetobacterium colombiensis]|uniref:SD-repeat containing protein B domain-containing protein n=1 Tax=Candidatus Cetobacterium colombiensis TaxID=3073100 RepID=A0ABU4WCZ4_9FUSO|nr:hypothetical protein [Candidatus Cetobacterium colombiensis]MDX8336579.1 hypothetical protein [Candidatus Cetobacterium colombiensis]
MFKKILTYFLVSIATFSAEYTLEELDKLKELDFISQEEYDVFKNELLGVQEGQLLYTLEINNQKVSNVYPIIQKNNKTFFSIISFFNNIGFTNYSVLSGVLTFKLGVDLREITINSNNNSIKGVDSLSSIKDSLIVENNDFYLESDLFKEIFLKNFKIYSEENKVAMDLSFETPEEIKMYLRNVQDGAIDSQNAGEIIFGSKRSLFDLGNVGLNIEGYAEKNNEDKKFNTDWLGTVEYQGGLLYGEFTANYDFRNNELNDTSLYYPDIWKQHSLEIRNSRSGDSSRQWEMTFRKERGFFRIGKNFVISENVPIGSKVELLYLGFPIDVKEADNGTVEFDNPEIQEDRQYVLRVYTPDGKIYNIDINTTSDYNQQKKGEIEYDISVRENHEYSKLETNANIYYGITENFTGGFNYSRTVETEDNKIGYLDTIRGEAVYSNTAFSFPYTLVLGGDKALSSYKNTENYSNKDRYGYDYTGQIDIKDFRFIVSQQHFGKYFDEKKSEDYSIIYNPFGSSFQINYDWGKTKYYDGSKDNSESVGFNASKTFKDLLVSFDYQKSLNSQDSYGLNLYYNGLKNYNVQLRNTWSEDGKDFETALAVSNKNMFDILDYTVELSYNEKDKEKFTFSVSLDYDSWFTTDISINESSQRYSAGIDKVFDLRNISNPIETIDSSRVKITTFLDENNNGVREENEKVVDNVAVKLREQEIVTDENGVAWFYGLPNDVTYDLKPTIRKPNYTMGDAKLKILGRQVGTIEAELPIKPMLNLTGVLLFDNSLKLSSSEKEGILENTLIKIINSKGKLVEYINPELDGSFEINGLFSEKYTLEILYTGTDYTINGVAENIQLSYKEDNNYLVQYKNGQFSLVKNKKEEKI